MDIETPIKIRSNVRNYPIPKTLQNQHVRTRHRIPDHRGFLKGDLPSIPVVMNELMTVISDQDAALYALRDLLKMDHSIFAQLLKVANTHQYRQKHENRITRIDDAVQVLGLEKSSASP